MSFEYDLKNSVWSLLEELSKKSGISEVIINSTDNIFIEREGELILLNMNLAPSDIISFCKDVAKFNRSLFGPNNPIVDGTLPDGSRINIISSVYTSSSPAITIRKYLKEIQRFDSSPAIFGLSPKWVTFLKTLIQAKMNIVISGGTGNGKTTFLNLLLQEVNPTERVITIEETKELSFSLPKTGRLVTAKGSSRVEEPLKIRDLLKNTLRMRPDRIIIGEVRGEEAFDLLQAMNTGHDGSMCTIHSNTPGECLSRIENLFLLSGYDVPLKAVRQQMSTAIDFIIQLDRSREGKRIVSRVAEVSNMEGDVILLQDLGNYVDGEFVFNGLVPKRMPKLLEYDLKSDFFL
jgi:pilus assembly protein CpaF